MKDKKKKDFTIIPNALLKHGLELGLNDADNMTYIKVKMYKWNDDDPYPSSKTIAGLRGVSKRSVEKSSRKMQELGYLKRPLGGRKPVWNFEALDEILDGITAGNVSLLEDAKKRVKKYVTANNSKQLMSRKKKLTAKIMTNNSEESDESTATFSSHEEYSLRKTKKKTKENNKRKENLVPGFLLERNKNYYKDEQKNEERRKLLREARKKMQGTGELP